METRLYWIILLYVSMCFSKSDFVAAYCQSECFDGFYDVCSAENDDMCDCYCDDACSFFNDCCEHLTESHTDVGISRGISCRYIGTKRCQVVDACVSQWENKTTKAKCEDTSSDATFTNVNKLPVFGHSSAMALMYKNRFCALCNLEEDFELVLPGIVPRSCNIFRLLEILPVVEEDIEKVLNYLSDELQCKMILEAAYRMIHCRKCGCIIDIIWNHGSTRAGYIQVNYLIETEEKYECVIKDNPAETAISDGVCNTGEKYMNDSCVRVFYVIAPVQIWRFIHTVTDLKMGNESYAVDTAADFIEAAKRAVAAKLKTERELVLYWQVREMKGKNSVSSQACTEIQLDIIVQTNILEDPDVMFMSKDLFEICEECRQRKTFVPGYMFSETACSIPQCQIDGLSNFIWSDLGKTESNMTDSENLMGTTAKTSVGNTSETLSKVTSDPGDFEAENKASPCSDTSMLDMVFVGLFLVAFTVLFPPLITID